MEIKFDEIKALVPQKFPLLMVDRVLSLEKGKRIVAIKNITGNEMSVTVLGRVMRHASVVQLASISVYARRGECAPGGHGTASSHGDHCHDSS